MFKRILALVLALALLAPGVRAQVSVPNTLVAGTTIQAAALNTNFSTLGNHALDRISGGNISGNVTMDPGVTIDGLDLSVALCASCAATFGSVTVNAVAIIGATGKIPGLTATYFTSIDASTLTGLNATNLASGTAPAARLGSGSPSSTTFLRGDSSWVTGPSSPVTIVKSIDYTAVANDFVICNGGINITLPAAASNANKMIDVKNNNGGTCTVLRSGSDLIDATTTQSINTPFQSMTFLSDGGTNWFIR